VEEVSNLGVRLGTKGGRKKAPQHRLRNCLVEERKKKGGGGKGTSGRVIDPAGARAAAEVGVQQTLCTALLGKLSGLGAAGRTFNELGLGAFGGEGGRGDRGTIVGGAHQAVLLGSGGIIDLIMKTKYRVRNQT